jgi:hypothetical protein
MSNNYLPIHRTRGMLATPDWTIVFNPRTGSRSLAAALRDSGHEVRHGHVRPEWVMKHTQSSRIIGVARDPMTWAWSFYWKANVQIPFEKWLDANHRDVGIYWGRGLNCYRDIITEYWVFEKGYPALLEHLGMQPDAAHHIGESEKPIDPYWYDGIEEYFPDDCALYRELTA